MRFAVSDLQRCAHCDDLVALCSVDLQQHRDRLLQHWAADIVKTSTWLVDSNAGDLAVSRGNCGSTDTMATFIQSSTLNKTVSTVTLVSVFSPLMCVGMFA